jgi:hypothetical protein
MRNLTILASLLVTLLWGCGDLRLPRDPNEGFKPPVIVQTVHPNSNPFSRVDSLRFYCPRVIGKFPFCDSLFLGLTDFKDSTSRIDCITDYKTSKINDLDASGLQLTCDYRQDVLEGRPDFDTLMGFPAFVVNSTDKIKYMHGKDGHVFALQEAKARDGKWYPIEGRCYDFCGNGRWATRMHPNEFFCFMVPKYQGSFKTQLRLRLQNNDVIYLSEPYEGTIQASQIASPENGYQLTASNEDDSLQLEWRFYGTRYPNMDQPGSWKLPTGKNGD